MVGTLCRWRLLTRFWFCLSPESHRPAARLVLQLQGFHGNLGRPAAHLLRQLYGQLCDRYGPEPATRTGYRDWNQLLDPKPLFWSSPRFCLTEPVPSSGGAPHLVGGLLPGGSGGPVDLRRALHRPEPLQDAALAGGGRGQEGATKRILCRCEEPGSGSDRAAWTSVASV